ncbi:hypothetical protein HK405_004877 [Cladochytrium tenue]|nr:hypothetical protein HK405_004877 [Cladochytrium tenue]
MASVTSAIDTEARRRLLALASGAHAAPLSLEFARLLDRNPLTPDHAVTRGEDHDNAHDDEDRSAPLPLRAEFELPARGDVVAAAVRAGVPAAAVAAGVPGVDVLAREAAEYLAGLDAKAAEGSAAVDDSTGGVDGGSGGISNRSSVYMIGNSLGPMPRGVRTLLNEELNAWAERGVISHFDHPHDRPWVTVDDGVTPESARIVGALPSEVALMNSLTANLHFLLVAFYRPTPARFKLLVEARAFPSDHFAVASQIRLHGLDPRDVLIEVAPGPGEHAIRDEDVVRAIEEAGDQLAAVMLGAVQFYSGQAFDLEGITAAGHRVGAMVGFDLAHAVGNIELRLHDWDVDFACWCTYKYLNSGPGGMGGAFVHERHGTGDLHRLAGWWGSDPATKFAMDNVFRAEHGARGFRVSNPSVLTTTALLASLRVFSRTSMRALRRRSELLTAYLELLLDGLLLEAEAVAEAAPVFQIITPREPRRRGCQLSLLFADAAAMEEAFAGLGLRGVLADERRPRVVRLSPAPLFCTFEDVFRCADALHDCLARRAGRLRVAAGRAN